MEPRRNIFEDCLSDGKIVLDNSPFGRSTLIPRSPQSPVASGQNNIGLRVEGPAGNTRGAIKKFRSVADDSEDVADSPIATLGNSSSSVLGIDNSEISVNTEKVSENREEVLVNNFGDNGDNNTKISVDSYSPLRNQSDVGNLLAGQGTSVTTCNNIELLNQRRAMNVTIADIAANQQPQVPKFTTPIPFNPQTDDAHDFIRNYETAANFNGWDERLKLSFFQNFLRGTAAIWFRTFAKRNLQATWADTLREFKITFIGPSFEQQLQRQLGNCYQKTHEKVLEYFFRVVDLCDQVDSAMAEVSILNYVVQGLLPKYQYTVNIQQPKTIRQLEKLLRHIHSADARQGELDDTVLSSQRSPIQTPVMNYSELINQKLTEDIKKLVVEDIKNDLGSIIKDSIASANAVSEGRLGRNQHFQNFQNRTPNFRQQNFERNPRFQNFQTDRYNGYRNASSQNYRPTQGQQYGNRSTQAQDYGNRAPHTFQNNVGYGNRDGQIQNSRTLEGRPICFLCNRPGHVVRMCPNRQGFVSENR